MIKVDKSVFGIISGKQVYRYVISNEKIEISFMSYGCIIMNIKVPDRTGKPIDIVLGHNTFEEYLKSTAYFGSLIGPVAGRISGGHYRINDCEYYLEKNERGVNHLHGGLKGLDKVVWESKEFKKDFSAGVEFLYEYHHPEFGYPGTIKYKLVYELNDENEFALKYYAESDRQTPVNMTNHSYFNLNGEDSGKNVLNHKMRFNSDFFVPLDSDSIPTGEILNCGNTPFDFKVFTKLEDAASSDYSQVKQVGGFDHPILMNSEKAGEPQVSAYNPDNGIILDVFTDQNCLVFYTSNGMDGSTLGKKGTPYTKQYAFCFESQGIPDAVNRLHFPSIIIDKNKPYIQNTIWKFSVE